MFAKLLDMFAFKNNWFGFLFNFNFIFPQSSTHNQSVITKTPQKNHGDEVALFALALVMCKSLLTDITTVLWLFAILSICETNELIKKGGPAQVSAFAKLKYGLTYSL